MNSKIKEKKRREANERNIENNNNNKHKSNPLKIVFLFVQKT